MIFEDLCFSYGSARVLEGVSAEVPEGRYTALVGPNGSGKTTLLSLACGFLRPRRGRALYQSRAVAQMKARERARCFAIVQQREAAAMPFTSLEVVLMGLSPFAGRLSPPGPAEMREAERLLARVGAARLAGQPVDKLSGGEFQRVVLARALMQRPRLLFLDEATSDLDIAAKLEVQEILRGLIAREGLTVLAVHHDVETAYRFADRVIALKAGRVCAQGAPAQVMTPAFFQTVFGVEARVLDDKCLLFLRAADKSKEEEGILS